MRWVWLLVAAVIGIVIGANANVASWFPSGWAVSLEAADHLSQVLLLAIAIGALIYAKGQVQAARHSNEQSLDIGWATLLLELDARWEGQALLDSRKIVTEIKEELTEKIGQDHPRLDDVHKAEKLGQEFGKRLAETRSGDLGKYLLIMRFCGFFETVGLMVDRGYMPLTEMDRLFRGPILTVDACFRTHISARQNETGVPVGLYEHALSLADRVKLSLEGG